MEIINFSELTITPARLPRLDTIARPRRAILRCIKLCILLQEYDCSQCSSMADGDWWERDSVIVEHALRALTLTLSIWESCGSGLTLDIGVCSPSDAKHHFQNFSFGRIDDHSETHSAMVDDAKRGWKGNRQVEFPPSESLFRVFSLIELTEDFWVDLPQVAVVTRMQFRRQTRHQWCQLSLRRLISCFRGLEIIHYEPWREWTEYTIEEADQYYVRLFESLPMHCLKQVVTFEDFDDYYVKKHPWRNREYGSVLMREANPGVSDALARASLSLQSISASFLVDAGQYFRACQLKYGPDCPHSR